MIICESIVGGLAGHMRCRDLEMVTDALEVADFRPLRQKSLFVSSSMMSRILNDCVVSFFFLRNAQLVSFAVSMASLVAFSSSFAAISHSISAFSMSISLWPPCLMFSIQVSECKEFVVEVLILFVHGGNEAIDDVA